jgi:hypothetical protein
LRPASQSYRWHGAVHRGHGISPLNDAVVRGWLPASPDREPVVSWGPMSWGVSSSTGAVNMASIVLEACASLGTPAGRVFMLVSSLAVRSSSGARCEWDWLVVSEAVASARPARLGPCSSQRQAPAPDLPLHRLLSGQHDPGRADPRTGCRCRGEVLSGRDVRVRSGRLPGPPLSRLAPPHTNGVDPVHHTGQQSAQASLQNWKPDGSTAVRETAMELQGRHRRTVGDRVRLLEGSP